MFSPSSKCESLASCWLFSRWFDGVREKIKRTSWDFGGWTAHQNKLYYGLSAQHDENMTVCGKQNRVHPMEHIKVDEALGMIWDNDGEWQIFRKFLFVLYITWSRKFSVGTEFIDICWYVHTIKQADCTKGIPQNSFYV